MTTVAQKIDNLLKEEDWSKLDPQDRLLLHVFYYGQHVAAKRVCDKSQKVFEEQERRANAQRYHRLIKNTIKIQGLWVDSKNKSIIYDPEYNSDFADFEIS